MSQDGPPSGGGAAEPAGPAGRLPPVRVSPFEAGEAAAEPGSPPGAATVDSQPSAWLEALDEASLMSPLASAAYGRSLAASKPSPPALRELWSAQTEEGEPGGHRWAGVAREART